MTGPIKQDHTQSILDALTNLKTAGNEKFQKDFNFEKSTVKVTVGEREVKIWVYDEEFTKSLENHDDALFKKFFDAVQKNNAAYQFSEAATQNQPRQKIHLFANDTQKQLIESKKLNKPANPNKPAVTRTYVMLSAASQTAISDTAKKFLQEITEAPTTKLAEQPKKEEPKPAPTPSHTPVVQAKAPETTPDAPAAQTSVPTEADVDTAVSEGREKAQELAEQEEAYIKDDRKRIDEKRDLKKSDDIKSDDINKHQIKST